MTKIPPGEYSVEKLKEGIVLVDGELETLKKSSYFLDSKSVIHNIKNFALANKGKAIVATIGFHLEGVPQLEIRERGAEEVLKECNFTGLSQLKGIVPRDGKGGSLYDRLIKAMHTYRFQPIAPVSEEETSAQILSLIDSYWKFDGRQFPMSNWHDKQDLMDEIRKLFKSLHRTQSGYTREQVKNMLNGSVILYELMQVASIKNEDDMPVISHVDKPNGGSVAYIRHDAMVKKINTLIASFTPSFTSVTIGDNNNIINFKYK